MKPWVCMSHQAKPFSLWNLNQLVMSLLPCPCSEFVLFWSYLLDTPTKPFLSFSTNWSYPLAPYTDTKSTTRPSAHAYTLQLDLYWKLAICEIKCSENIRCTWHMWEGPPLHLLTGYINHFLCLPQSILLEHMTKECLQVQRETKTIL